MSGFQRGFDNIAKAANQLKPGLNVKAQHAVTNKSPTDRHTKIQRPTKSGRFKRRLPKSRGVMTEFPQHDRILGRGNPIKPVVQRGQLPPDRLCIACRQLKKGFEFIKDGQVCRKCIKAVFAPLLPLLGL